MKKSVILMFLLFILTAAGVFHIQKTLLLEKDNVTITQNTLYGDISEVKDVIFERNVRLKKNLYWKTTYTVGEPSAYTTDYTFYPYGYSQELEIPYQYVSFEENLHYDFDPEEDESQMFGMELAYKKLFDETPEGQERYEVVRVKDYLDYYSFDLNFHLNGAFWDFRLEDILYRLNMKNMKNISEENRQLAEEQMADLEAFQEFFKVPVLETQACEIGVSKTENGKLGGWTYSTYNGGTVSGNMNENSCGSLNSAAIDEEVYYLPGTYESKEDEDEFCFDVTSTSVGNTCYLTFQTHTAQGDIIDTSQIPGGYGIYSFTFDAKKEEIDTDSLKMVYALDPSVQFVSLEKDTSGKHILMFTEEEGQCYLTVIDIKTMETKQKIAYAPDIEESKTRCYWIYEDFVIAQYLYEKAVVISLDESGMYHVEFTIDVSEEENAYSQEMLSGENKTYPLAWIGSTMKFDWNGEKIVLSDSLMDETSYRDKCGIYLAVFDENGIQYYGEYTYSLDTGDDTSDYYNYNCHPAEVDSLNISWHGKR